MFLESFSPKAIFLRFDGFSKKKMETEFDKNNEKGINK